MKNKEWIAKMSLEEKAAFLIGKNEWQSREFPHLGIENIFFSDGPHGVRKQEGSGDHLGLGASLPSTCFPTAATVAGSWDEDLAVEIGEALGTEAASMGVDVLLGPGLNIKRSPLCGRNFEYFSEDPYLAGKMASGYVRGIQSKGISACPKHFAVNSQELRRMAMNSVLDERTLREIYLTGFEIAVKEGKARTIMSAYNEVNGVYANENVHLLDEILRKEWGFDGIVVTDWGASNDIAKGIHAGSNLEMPAPGFASAREILEAVKEGALSEEDIDLRVDELLSLHQAVRGSQKPKSFDKEKHHALAKRVAAESAVLLKNDEQILPLSSNAKVAIIGDFAFVPRYQGAGSSMVNSTKLDTIEGLAGQYPLSIAGMCKGYKRDGSEDDLLLSEAVNLAKEADVVLYFFGLDELSESEGLDREHLRIPQNQIHLLHELAKVNPKVVGILSAGASVEMPWQKDLKAILHTYLCGQAGAGAALDILVGKVNPSGRLAESYPMQYEDTPAFSYYPAAERNSEYRESVFIGYRYYDTVNQKVLFPFGFGLSYTEFSYSDLSITPEGVRFKIKNTGKYDGAEVAQLYIGLETSEIFRPSKELKGFKKVFLKAGEEKYIEIAFDDKSFRFWNIAENAWEIEGGSYTIMIGSSSADIHLSGKLEVHGTAKKFAYSREAMLDYFAGRIKNIPDQEFEKLLGTRIPDGKWKGELEINDAICQMYYAKSALARWAYRFLTKKKKDSEKKGKPDLNILFVYNMPFRAIAKMSHGACDMNMVHGIVDLVNGHFFRGLGRVISGYFKNRSANKRYEKMLKSMEK